MSFEDFAALVAGAAKDYIGNERKLILSAMIVVEQMWPEKAGEFAEMRRLKW